MSKREEIKNFLCPDCGGDECELEQDWDGDELITEDLVCNNCGYREELF